MQIEDLDGNVLRVGAESKTDRPFGPWLDQRGDRWLEGTRVDRGSLGSDLK
jgi:hypothetical protein